MVLVGHFAVGVNTHGKIVAWKYRFVKPYLRGYETRSGVMNPLFLWDYFGLLVRGARYIEPLF